MNIGGQIVPALEDLRDVVISAGIPAHLERDKTPVPGAFVGPVNLHTPTLSGAMTLRAAVILVSGEVGEPASLLALAGLLEKLMSVIDPDGDIDTSLVFPVRNSPLPAWRVYVDLELDEE